MFEKLQEEIHTFTPGIEEDVDLSFMTVAESSIIHQFRVNVHLPNPNNTVTRCSDLEIKVKYSIEDSPINVNLLGP